MSDIDFISKGSLMKEENTYYYYFIDVKNPYY